MSDGRKSPPTEQGPEALAARLADELAAAWRDGRRPPVEEFLARRPEVAESPEAAVRLIYEEVCLRQECGEAVDREALLARFPLWAAQLRLLLDCHSLLLRAGRDRPTFPQVGEAFEGLVLEAELGRGAQGQVFLAADPVLGRKVVLKVTRCDGREHLTLARLQHTHVAPLYWVRDLPERGLRVLCMPYLGGTVFSDLLCSLGPVPVERRSGRAVLEALDAACQGRPAGIPAAGPARGWLARADYPEAVCWLGACLAEALQYAHERGVVHLDVKPGNVLIAPDGQPLLLDFHLGRPPLEAGGEVPEWFGGTRGAMSPEQAEALEAARVGRPAPRRVDGRADVYSLGVLLDEALRGPPTPGPDVPLWRANPRVSVGLSDVIARCLRADPASRYQSAGELAEDLRRHLRAEPLRGVPNRSLRERWDKWRRRRPHGLVRWGAAAALVVACLGAVAGAAAFTGRRLAEAEAAQSAGRAHLERRQYAAAAVELERGLELARTTPGGDAVAADLEAQLRRARRGEAGETLHALVERLLFIRDPEALAAARRRSLDESCQAVWEARAQLRDRVGSPLSADEEERVDGDLLDLTLFWADLLRHDGRPRDALALLDEARRLLGASNGLARVRQSCAEAAGDAAEALAAAHEAQTLPAPTASDLARLGRALMRSGRPAEAEGPLREAVRLQPDLFWARFDLAMCAHELGHDEEAETACRICIALRPRVAEGYHNLAVVLSARGRAEEALSACDRALTLDPHLAVASLHHATLDYAAGRYDDALAFLARALDDGASPALVHYNTALVRLAREERREAVAELRKALVNDPGYREARELLDRLQTASHAQATSQRAPHTPPSSSGMTEASTPK